MSNDSDLRSTATDVDNHVTHRLMDIETDPYGSCHRFVNQMNLLGTRVFGTVPDSSSLHLCNSAGNTDDHLTGGGVPLPLHLLDHSTDHLLGHFKVGDDAVAQRPDGPDILVGLLVHQLRFMPDSHRLSLVVQSHDGGLIQNDPFVSGIDQRIGCSQIDGDVCIEKLEETLLLLSLCFPVRGRFNLRIRRGHDRCVRSYLAEWAIRNKILIYVTICE